jgi:hypothetical protein
VAAAEAAFEYVERKIRKVETSPGSDMASMTREEVQG